MLIVMKFGGSSVADAPRIRAVADIINTAAAQHRVVPVVSALDGVTELLLDLCDAAAGGDTDATNAQLATIDKRHALVAEELGAQAVVAPHLDRLRTLALGVLALEELTPRVKDAIVAHGERLSAAMLAHILCATALDGHEAGIVTNDHFGEADPLPELSAFNIRQQLLPTVQSGARVVVCGFVAANQHGVTSTLGRGGSDYTATILGTALSADEIWIYSDVDGLMTADPRSVPSARLLGNLSFEEAVEMGKFGAKSMHPRALEPAAAARVPVRMRSTFKPTNPGTLISDAGSTQSASPVLAVPMLKGLAMLTVGGGGMVGRAGSAAAIFDALAEARVNVHMICQSVSEAGISIVVSAAQAENAQSILDRTGREQDRRWTIDVKSNLAVVAAVGAGMKGAPGVAAKIFTAIAEQKVNVIAIAQGSSELSISIVVEAASGNAAVAAIHKAFIDA
ncbi:MAG: aspartate kinase [Phycisphaerales bacterium]|nr:aspartate kinase [Phycisphaerales bacterium]